MAETRRAACDRCHAQKLRCLHSPGSDGRCVRCVRADVECVFSPRAARGSLMGHCRGSTSRPRSRPLALSDTHTTSQRQPQSQHPPTPHLVPPPPASRPDPLLAPPFTFDAAAFATDTASTLNSLLGAPTDVDAWQLHLPATPLETGPGHIVRRLADLNVGLYDCAAAIPPLAPRDATASSGSPPKAQHGRLLALDRIFSQTQALVDILRDLNALPAATPADRATLLLVLSCYDRTMAVHEHILAHMRGCVERALTPRHADGATVVLPPLHIGSYAPPPSSAVAMQMLLVVIMAAQLLDQLQLALGVRPSGCAPSASPAASPADSVLAATEEEEKEEGGWETGAWQLELPPGKPHADFSDDEVDAMRERAVSVSREIVQVKALLLERSAT